ncbi:hypothetical protein Dimus_005900, partial [Dionaea muscipula]
MIEVVTEEDDDDDSNDENDGNYPNASEKAHTPSVNATEVVQIEEEKEDDAVDLAGHDLEAVGLNAKKDDVDEDN